MPQRHPLTTRVSCDWMNCLLQRNKLRPGILREHPPPWQAADAVTIVVIVTFNTLWNDPARPAIAFDNMADTISVKLSHKSRSRLAVPRPCCLAWLTLPKHRNSLAGRHKGATALHQESKQLFGLLGTYIDSPAVYRQTKGAEKPDGNAMIILIWRMANS